MTTMPGWGPGVSGRARKPPPFSVERSMTRVRIDGAWYRWSLRRRREVLEAAVSSSSRATWARGAVGSAPEWHSGGQGFESTRVHQISELEMRLQHRAGSAVG